MDFIIINSGKGKKIILSLNIIYGIGIIFFFVFQCFFLNSCTTCNTIQSNNRPQNIDTSNIVKNTKITYNPIDTILVKKQLKHIIHDSASVKWPVNTICPLPGAILPFNRIVAYYGNFYSIHMGILGEYEPEEMLKHLNEDVMKWQKADSLTPVIPALDYIAVSAQGSPGKENKYRLRMPFTQIDKAIAIAKRINALVFLDVQVGQSTLKEEIPLLEQYLKLPNVHLAIDPEFSMKTNRKPGSIIGTFDADDINFVTDYLTTLVHKDSIPPKILVVHRFTKGMITNYRKIKLNSEVQIVINMDGWGTPAKKISTYNEYESNEPVQFTGFKIFYKNDISTNPGNRIMTPEEILHLYPSPIFITYQ
jgi:hypothetical protein